MPAPNQHSGVNLKQKLHGSTATIGSWIQLGNVGVAEIMALAGFDWLVVDLEHSVISIETATDSIRVIENCGVAPLVRLTSNDPNQIKRCLLTAHMSSMSVDCRTRMEIEATQEAVRFVSGQQLLSPVPPEEYEVQRQSE